MWPRAALACSVLAGCSAAPLRPPVFTLAPVGGAGTPAFELPALPELPAELTAPAPGNVRLLGLVRLADPPTGANVAEDGSVAGTPVMVLDVASGRRIGAATTYYDGSFVFDLPVAYGKRAILFAADLIDRRTSQRKVPLAATVLVTAGESERRVNLTPGSTVLVAFLNDLALSMAGIAPPSGMELTTPGVASQMAQLVASFDQEDVEAFVKLAETAPELQHPPSVEALGAGLRRYVQRLRASTRRSTV